MGVFAQHVADFAERGLAAFPVDTRAKRPAVKGWQQASAVKSRAWARSPKLAAADGVGLLMGKPSGVVEVDVDAAGEAWLAVAVDRFGETPIKIRTASGKSKLWYRHNGEGRHIRPFPDEPIDILGNGFTIAPPSRREDLGTCYAFVTGGLDDVANLPTMPPTERQTDTQRLTGSAANGARNVSLWRWCMTEARHCEDVEALSAAAAAWNGALIAPLSAREVEQCARSAWKYEAAGRNFIGLKKPQLTNGDRIMDGLIDHPEAYALYLLFQRWHGNRNSFAIAPTAMSSAGSPPWPRRRIESARDILLERGFLAEVRSPDKSRRKSGLYSLTAQPIPGGGAGEGVYSDCWQICQVSEGV
ncbi:bifunctional DNA primase/polymerase [Roseivivax sediminis]|uniref:Primase C terminal 1 (PriCT-1) n=1 Tax=Roseivivax sediminis TaxID=936889 RepID=A0A1I1UCR6_9RHOB|nr:bifunctional DNA primase/polymerase [Roseivivax sediminis]SFD67398.1 Primase C terminal 1 (PriCT-1) [Roseivivax sediminis]